MTTPKIFSWFVLLFNYGWTIELLLTYCWSNVDMIAYHTHTHKSKSTITVVEGNGLDHIGQRSKKDGERQDPSLWEIFQFLLKTHSQLIPWLCQLQRWPSLESNWISHEIFNCFPMISPVRQSRILHLCLQHVPPATSRFSAALLSSSWLFVNILNI